MAHHKKKRPPLADSIRTRRRALDLTQEELAKRARLERGHLARIETGATTPQLSTLGKIAKALKVSPADLLVA